MKKFVVALAAGLAVISQAGPASAGKDLDEVRPIRDEIDERVRTLLAELVRERATRERA